MGRRRQGDEDGGPRSRPATRPAANRFAVGNCIVVEGDEFTREEH
jgi:hypothetical protein